MFNQWEDKQKAEIDRVQRAAKQGGSLQYVGHQAAGGVLGGEVAKDCASQLLDNGEVTVNVNRIVSSLGILEKTIYGTEDKLDKILSSTSPLANGINEARPPTNTKLGSDLENINDVLCGLIRRLEEINSRIDL